MANKYGAVGFNINSSTDFHWKPNAGKELCRTDGVRREITLHADRVYNRAMAMTPSFPGMYNNNYYEHVALAGKKNMWRGRVVCGNPASLQHNYRNNTLLKALSGA